MNFSRKILYQIEVEDFSLLIIKLLIFILIWEIIQFFLWSYKGVLYNSYDYFFPFQTFDIAKYDITEFALYGVLFPIVITILTVQLKKILR